MTEAIEERIELDREDGYWRWRYRTDEGDGLELWGNQSFESEAAARSAAQTAYPDVPFGDEIVERRNTKAAARSLGRNPFFLVLVLALVDLVLLIAIVRSERS